MILHRLADAMDHKVRHSGQAPRYPESSGTATSEELSNTGPVRGRIGWTPDRARGDGLCFGSAK